MLEFGRLLLVLVIRLDISSCVEGTLVDLLVIK